MKRIYGRGAAILAAALATMGTMPLIARADKFWKDSVGSGNWNTGDNWSAVSASGADNGGIPLSGDTAFIENADATSRNVLLNVAASIAGLRIGNSGNETNTLTQSSSFNLTSASEMLGLAISGSKGVHDQSAATNTVTGSLVLGDGSGSTGTYNLSGTASLTVNGNEYAGRSGTGSFAQDGGANTVGNATTPGFLLIGYFSGASGSYSLSETGSLTVNGHEYVGWEGTGSFTQSGGTHTIGSATVPRDLELGRHPGSSGTYELGGTSILTVYGLDWVGDEGTGSFIQSGGTHTIGLTLVLARTSTSSGTFELSDSASLTVKGNELVGDGGPGSFNQIGGTHIVGSTMTPRNLIVGRLSGSNGSYVLSGTGSLTVNGDEYVGYNSGGAGSFTQSGGSNTVSGVLILALDSGSSGTYTLSSGSLSAPAITANANGTFNYNGGSLAATNLTLNGGLAEMAPSGGNRTMVLNSLSISAGGKLYIGDNKAIVRGGDLGSWNGSTLAVALASDVRPATATATALWGGQVIAGTDTLVMYTYGGDANLDGKLNIDDYVRIDQGIAASMTGWSNGDFNYDGKINIDDYTTVIDSNIGNQTGVFFTGSGLEPVVAVPEPVAGLLAVFSCVVPGLRPRRRVGDRR